MKFFFDRCMSIRLCQMIAIWEEGKHVLAHHDEDGRFNPDTVDTTWINTLSQDADHPIVVSGDTRILKRPDEVAALSDSGLTFFCLMDQWPELEINEMVWKFLKVWPNVVKHARQAEPTVFQIFAGKSLKVEQYALTKKVRKK